MSFEPLPDHYKALGIDRTADAATIKKTYRKLVLTCHPDKVTDEALKAQKQDEFHKIQQAYETLSDDTRRATYEAELKLQQLRREKLARTASGTTVEPKSARFQQPTSGGSYTANTSARYTTEERRPTGASSSRHNDYDDERYHGTHKTDSHFASPRRSSPRPTPSSRSSREKYEKEVRREKPSDRTRSSTTKARDSERRDRTGRFPHDSEGSSGEDRARLERERAYKTRAAEDDSQRREERRRDDRRHDDYENTTPRKLSVQQDDAIRYIHKSRAEAEANLRPSPVRTASRDYYEPSSRSSRHREVRPEPAPRRSSARPKERSSMPSRRDTDRGNLEVVDWDDRRPSFKQSASSPADIRIPVTPQRSATESYRRSERSPPPRFPGLSRSATMPTVPVAEAGGSRREAKGYPRQSGLRNEANGSPERDAYPTVPAPQQSNKTYYSYSPADGGVKAMDPPHRTILREPERVRHRSPSPIGKPPMGANRPTLHSAKTYAPSGRTSRQASPVRDDRGRSNQMKYGEVSSDYTRRRGMPERQSSFDPHNVTYAPSFGPEDIRWAPKRGDERYSDRKPTLGRTTTSVY
ncbi:hypothetical protein C7974DRAFT_412535 [Boeremia exigua]|uniref:uncharacterized protein n=1 Tax=Boeremia exigua TaxID=749465 RepID=UPI001E8CC59D|nr:uncharacterized protein C7974DRAFT_412535 [Boeremia exigua]KAH6633550.1 hypothetical protein C7974DRAFT_412535 [Boeremia exigua]